MRMLTENFKDRLARAGNLPRFAAQLVCELRHFHPGLVVMMSAGFAHG
jgi:hypothetical protein